MKDTIIFILSAVCAALIWTFIAMNSSISLIEKSNDTLLQRVWELQRVDKQKCVDLLLNDKI